MDSTIVYCYIVISITCEINWSEQNLVKMSKTMLVLCALLGWTCLSIDT